VFNSAEEFIYTHIQDETVCSRVWVFLLQYR